MAEQPRGHARRLERGRLHVEIPPLGIEAQPHDVAMGDADLEAGGVPPRRLRDPADGGFGAGLRRARTGEEVHRLTLDVVGLHDRLHKEVDVGVALGRPAKPLPHLRFRTGVVVVVAGHHDHGLAGETPQHGGRPVDVFLLHPRAVEEVASDHEEVGVSVVCDGHEPPQREKTLVDEAGGRVGRIRLEGKAEMVVGGVDDPNRHGVGRAGSGRFSPVERPTRGRSGRASG